MKNSHTTGPWEGVAGTTTGRAVIAPGRPKIRRNVAMVGGVNRDANALLIAAAPDMLAALDALEAAELGTEEGRPIYSRNGLWTVGQMARAAIAKARGEA